ncbi:hypothetical protein HA402_003844 [Bradysia odoriphaga]|nr:hypothetical protein HA402_003844 [Bradysia odoriphaga]
MPRIDPQQLLNCLSVLLASNGGIKSSKEVNRLVQLMGKFSKKLVSKCIYVQILKSTETELLGQFMADGGWALSHIWLQDGILTRNWPLVQELLELMLLCPVDVQRLKSNSAPKLVKGLSKEGGNEGVRILASKLVEQWLKIVKGESSLTPVTVQQQDVVVAVLKPEVPEVKVESTESGDDEALDEADESEDLVDPLEIPSNHVPQDDVDSKERLSKAKSDGLVYKITVKDGKQVFAKLEASPKKEADSEKAKVKSELNIKIKNEDSVKGKSEPIAKLKIATVDGKKQIKDKVKQESVESKEQDKVEANKKVEKAKSETVKEKSKSDDKERRNSKETAKESGDVKESKEAKEKRKDSSSKSSSSSKHSSSSRSSSQKSSRSDSKHKTSSSSSSSRDKNRDSERDKDRDKDRDRSSKSSSSKSSSKSSSSSSSKSSQSKEKRDSIDEKVSQSMKDKDTLTKVIPPSITKLGKIPKKTTTSDGDSAATTETGPSKKSSISIEVKKDTENRPKTVKTFNSKFRSHGLAEEAPPPPSRRGLQRPSSQPTAGASIPGTAVTKRPSPPPEKKDAVVPEKKLKIDTSLAVEKPGIKLIPAKPKTPVLVESDMFMDAIFASQTTKKDGARKRKRMTSQSTTETTKPEKVQSPDAKSVAPKFYQDTLDNETKDDDKADESKKQDGTDVETIKTATETEDGADVEMPEVDDPVETKETENEVVENQKPPGPGCGPNGPPGVLTILKRKGPKKQLRWRPQESLEEIHYFELDETERTNVSRNSVDSHQTNEREGDAFLIVRKMNADDQMTEQIPWTALLIVDDVPPHPQGKDSKEKKIQSDRELTCLRAIYFNRSMIPESPAEPDMEHYQITDPAIIPLDDPNGTPEGIKNFVGYAWPEPRGSPRHQPIGFEDPVPFNNFPPNFGFNNGPGWNNQPNLLPPAFNGPPNLLNMNTIPPEPVNNMNMNMNPMNPMNQPFPQNQNFGPPNGMRNNNFNGNNFGNDRMNAGPPQNNPNWFRPNGPQNNWRPPMGNNNSNNNNNNNNNNSNRPRHDWNPRNICRAFAKGFCRHGDKCQWLHPGINCPPFN